MRSFGSQTLVFKRTPSRIGIMTKRHEKPATWLDAVRNRRTKERRSARERCEI
jgi:hypothetical protein